jgi:serine/threonine protein phosphatase PrpC
LTFYDRINKFQTGKYDEALYRSFIEIDKNLSTKEAKHEMLKIREKNPEGKNPFLELLGLNDGMDRGDDNIMEMLDNIGCTANVLFIHDGMYYCANAGDSRCVLSQRGRAIELSEDHKPENPREYERIINAG